MPTKTRPCVVLYKATGNPREMSDLPIEVAGFCIASLLNLQSGHNGSYKMSVYFGNFRLWVLNPPGSSTLVFTVIISRSIIRKLAFIHFLHRSKINLYESLH